MASTRPLTAPEASRSMALSVGEGVLYAVMVGFGDAYFLADAVRLGASSLEQALVVTLPLLGGALGSVAALALLRRAPRRRPVVLAGALTQATVLIALVVMHLTLLLGLGLGLLLGDSWALAAIFVLAKTAADVAAHRRDHRAADVDPSEQVMA